ncbi:hypothetical protein DVQ51_09360 [Yersinia enterocolitica]|nr:hypothetical protein [Yersinia enterocolitica]EKN6170920.1 hypothetical protein [Yersinia enterocolitica]
MKRLFLSEVNDNAIYSSVSEGLTVPRGASTAYAVTTLTARFPFILLRQQSEAFWPLHFYALL